MGRANAGCGPASVIWRAGWANPGRSKVQSFGSGRVVGR